MRGDYKPVVTRADMRRLDAFTIAEGTPAIELMERAGRSITGYLLGHCDELTGSEENEERTYSLLVLTGPGNNGGDGFVVARLVAEQGWRATVAVCGSAPAPGTESGLNMERWIEARGVVIDATSCLTLLRDGSADDTDIILDCLFGTGLDRPLEGRYAELITMVNASGLPVVSVDMPSGLCADTGRPLGVAVVADATVTLGAAKPGLFVGLGPDHSGRIAIADIGLRGTTEAGVDPIGQVVDEETCELWVPHRRGTTHKGQLGHVLVAGGSAGKTGAVLLGACAALRTGAGLVTMAVPASLAAVTDAALFEAMTISLADDGAGELAVGAWSALVGPLGSFGAAVIGPGLGTGAGAIELVPRLVEEFPGALVIDADALNVLARLEAGHAQDLFRARRRSGHRPAILTPHPGEMARLLSITAADVQLDRLAACRKLADSLFVTAVLKGAGTLVSSQQRTGFNSSGNPGMATPGMGDVLAGIIAAFAAQVADPFTAAALAVYVHGLAADILADSVGGAGFLASEVADNVPHALGVLRNGMP